MNNRMVLNTDDTVNLVRTIKGHEVKVTILDDGTVLVYNAPQVSVRHTYGIENNSCLLPAAAKGVVCVNIEGNGQDGIQVKLGRFLLNRPNDSCPKAAQYGYPELFVRTNGNMCPCLSVLVINPDDEAVCEK